MSFVGLKISLSGVLVAFVKRPKLCGTLREVSWLLTVTVIFSFALNSNWVASHLMSLPMSVTAVTGVVGTEADGLAELLEDAAIGGNPVSFAVVGP